MSDQPMTSERLVRIVGKSGLIDADKFDRWVEDLREKLDGRLPGDPEKITRALVRAGLITAWHSEKLLGGKYKGFFLGRYKLLGHIGTGGMSSVYLAEHTRMGDRRAIKVLPRHRVGNATYLARFQQEARAIASLNHPGIVRAYDIDNQGDVHYIVMEYVDGLDLQRIVKRDGPMDAPEAAAICVQAARGLHHAHRRGLIHRDVKPANVLIDRDGTVKLLDMGLALIESADDESLTVMNNENVLGTADYLAPEQALNSHDVDARTDLYGLGCTMYYLLAGRPPFTGGTLAQRIVRHQQEDPEPINTHRQGLPPVPGELEGVIVKMMQKKPEYRYQNAAEVAAALSPLSVNAESKVAAKTREMAITLGGDESSGSTPGINSGVAVATGPGGGLGSGLGSGSMAGGPSSLAGRRGGSRVASGSFDTAVAFNDETLGDRASSIGGSGGSGSRGSGLGGSNVSLHPSRVVGGPASSASGPSSASGLSSGGSGMLDLEVESGYRPAAASRPTTAKRTLDTPLLIALATVLFVVAAAMGFAIARLTG